MKVPCKVNNFRRRAMQSLTKNIGNSASNPDYRIENPSEIQRILVCRPNHRLGNMLLVTPLIQELAYLFPNAKVDLFVKGGVAFPVFEKYENVDRIISLPKKPFSSLFQYLKGWFRIKSRKYDIAINVDWKSSSGRIATQISNASLRIFGKEITAESPDQHARHIAKSPVWNLRSVLSEHGFSVVPRPIPTLDIKLSEAELEAGRKELDKIFPNGKKTISFFTYGTGRKCYSEDWWAKFYEQAKERYSDYNLLEILPVENVSSIHFAAPTFYSKDIREIAALIANTEAFIGADSGIMHLASAAQAKTMGLFSVTDSSKYEPYNAGSLAMKTGETLPNEWFGALNRMLAANVLLFTAQISKGIEM